MAHSLSLYWFTNTGNPNGEPKAQTYSPGHVQNMGTLILHEAVLEIINPKIDVELPDLC